MTQPEMPLEKFACSDTNPGGFWDPYEKVYHVYSYQHLIQVSGYVKHVISNDRNTYDNSDVYFRGQKELYGHKLIPTLFRDEKKDSHENTEKINIQNRLSAIKAYCDDKVFDDIFTTDDSDIRKAILQHYGINTEWIDIVDNIWVALWFSCYECIFRRIKKDNNRATYVDFIQRTNSDIITDKKAGEKADKKTNKHAYIHLIKAGRLPNEKISGVFSNGESKLIDLRICAPSTFVRPHAQHGLLVKCHQDSHHQRKDYADLIVGTIRIDLVHALDWLGQGQSLTKQALFPSAFYDYGYADLLAFAPDAKPILGNICIV